MQHQGQLVLCHLCISYVSASAVCERVLWWCCRCAAVLACGTHACSSQPVQYWCLRRQCISRQSLYKTCTEIWEWSVLFWSSVVMCAHTRPCQWCRDWGTKHFVNLLTTRWTHVMCIKSADAFKEFYLISSSFPLQWKQKYVHILYK